MSQSASEVANNCIAVSGGGGLHGATTGCNRPYICQMMCSGSFGGFLPVKDFRRMERSWTLFLLFLFWQQHYSLGWYKQVNDGQLHFILPEPQISIWWIHRCCTCIYYRLVFHILHACSQGHNENSCWKVVVGFLSFEPFFSVLTAHTSIRARPTAHNSQCVIMQTSDPPSVLSPEPFTLQPLGDFSKCRQWDFKSSFMLYFWPLFLCFLSSCNISSIFFCLSTA